MERMGIVAAWINDTILRVLLAAHRIRGRHDWRTTEIGGESVTECYICGKAKPFS